MNEWACKYINLNQGREGKQMLIGENKFRDNSVVMEVSPLDIVVAIKLEAQVSIKTIDCLEGQLPNYRIDHKFFNMTAFDEAVT